AAVAVAMVLGALTARADVTVRGTVQYWDRLDNRYKPAQGTRVEVEGDWFWKADPEVLTNDSGFYQATLSNPPWWWSNYDDVHINAYAQTPGLIKVKEAWYSWYAYYGVSRSTDNVGSGQVVEINLRVGGPQNNLADSPYRTPDETANAFLVDQEMLA